ncbi:Basal-body rod modification protein FlgD [bacterium HR15]|nr:Basal-body rod modification protein FlgD [bacterium HR15]
MNVLAVQSGIHSSLSASSRAALDTYQFLRLLIIELTSQNPLDPVKDRDFLAQMAQLNTAQGVERMGQILTTFQASSLIGREVEAVLPSGVRVSGKVQAVEISGGRVYLRVDNQQVPFEAIQTIR